MWLGSRLSVRLWEESAYVSGGSTVRVVPIFSQGKSSGKSRDRARKSLRENTRQVGGEGGGREEKMRN